MEAVKPKKERKLSERGNWLVVMFVDGEIWWCNWIQTWAGVQASKRNLLKDVDHWRSRGQKVDVKVLDIPRMIDFAAVEGHNEILELEALFNK